MFDCIEEYLNHPLATDLSLELEVRNHLFDSITIIILKWNEI